MDSRKDQRKPVRTLFISALVNLLRPPSSLLFPSRGGKTFFFPLFPPCSPDHSGSTMGVVMVSEMLSCAGRPLSSPPGLTADAAPQVTDEEAVTDSFIPADSVSAVLISPRRVLVTGGILADERVLPLTVVRFLDLNVSPRADHTWTKPLALRPTSKRGKRKRSESAFPVCRMEQTLTFVPESASLFLIGGLKVGGKDEAKACKTMFAFDVRAKVWECVEVQNPKADREHVFGPRFAHTAVYVAHVGGESRSSKARKSSGYILAYGGYTSTEDRTPCHAVHVYDVRASRWSLQILTDGADPPRRAYHAGVVTASSRYFVAHGGQCSHLDDTGFLSSDLVAFDILRSHWVRPKLSPSSCPPPTARKRHCMVNGIGKHAGAIVLFGGELCSGSYSNELFVLRLIEPTTPEQYLLAMWEKVDVRTPEPLIAAPPIPVDAGAPQPEMSQEERMAKHTGTAGGTLLAVPELKKYLVVGGRGANGIRKSPLLLDASEVENLDRLEVIVPRKNEQIEVLPVSVQPAAKPPTTVVRRNGVSMEPSSTVARPDGHPVEPSASLPVTRARQEAQLQKRRDAGKRIPLCSPPDSVLRQISDEDNLPILPKLKTPVGDPMQDVSYTPDRKTLSERRNASLQQQQNALSPSISPTKAMATGLKKNHNSGEGSDEIRPATSIRPLSAGKIGRRKPSTDTDDYVMDLVDDDEDFDVEPVRDMQPPENLKDLETPPTKRRRFINGRRNGSVSRPGNDGHALGSEIDDTPGSDFVAASDLAKRGKRAARSVRGRGRRRGDGTRRKRSVTVAEEREALREKEAEETLLHENARLVRELQTENKDLKLERNAVKKDNLELNEQMKSLLYEVEDLRAFRREQGSIGKASSQKQDRIVSSQNHDRYQNPREIQQVDRSEHISNASESEELKMLQSKTSDLLEEYEDIVAERDELNKAMKEADEGSRVLQTELHVAKNKHERLETERDQLRRQTSELRALATEAGVARDTATNDLRKAEEGNSALKRDIERLQDQLREANSRCVEEKLELSNAHRLVSTVKGQLNEAQKKYDHFDSKERRLKGELGSQQGRLEELHRLVDQANGEKQKIEERNIELVTEIESLKTDYDRKQKECQMALRDVEKCRLALDHEKKEVAHLDIEVTKLRRDLNRVQREKNSISMVMKRKDDAILALRPALMHITNEFGALTMSAGQDDVEYSFACGCRHVAISSAGKQIEHGDTQVNGRREKSVEAPPISRSNSSVEAKRAVNSKHPQPHSPPESEDLKSPVPPSEEEEEP